jgi:Fic family protein
MQETLQKINLLSQKLQALLPMKPEDKQRLEKKIRLELNYNSNHIEGNTLTYGETELLLIFGKTTGNHEAREYKEMEAHDTAYTIIKEWAADKDKVLTEADIRNINKIILVQPFWKEAITPDGQETRKLINIGTYKEQPNSVRLANGEIFNYASPVETPILMQKLIEWFRNEDEKKELHPVMIAALLHYKFVRIHPFDDGNGRISRLLMNYVLLKNNLPPVIIKSSDKKNYLFALNLADTGNVDAFNEYIANQLIWSLDIYIKAAKGQSIEEDEDFIKEIELIKREVDVKGNITKSPKLIYETFIQFNNSIWLAIKQTLLHFDRLFNESKEVYNVNLMNQQYKKRNIFDPPFLRSTEPKPIEIFGYDIYETDVRTIDFYKSFYGLKGAKKINSYTINATLEFTKEFYSIQIELNSNKVFNSKKNYIQFILEDEKQKILSELSNTFLALIKKSVKEE